MPWNNLPADQTTDWTHVDFLNQFIDAYNERASIILEPGTTNPAWISDPDTPLGFFVVEPMSSFLEGEYVCSFALSSPSIPEIQSRLETLCHYFGRPSLFPIGTETELDASTYGEGLFTRTTWRSEAGLPADGFTRKYPREISSIGDAGTNGWRARHTGDTKFYDRVAGVWELSADQSTPADVLTEYGFMEAGDYVGPWIFNELQAGLQALDSVRLPVGNSFIGKQTTTQTGYAGSGVGGYVDDTGPIPDKWEDMAALAYAAAGWGTSGVNSAIGLYMNYSTKLPNKLIGGVLHRRFQTNINFPDLSIGFGRIYEDLTRTVTALYLRADNAAVNGSNIFEDFGTGLVEGWNDITGDYDPEVPGAGEDWTASMQWPWTVDQTTKPPNIVATDGWFDNAFNGVIYNCRYEEVAGYVQFSGFDYP